MNTVSITVRIPKQWHEQMIQEAAAWGNCSLSARVRYHLGRSLRLPEATDDIVYDTPEPAHQILTEQGADNPG